MDILVAGKGFIGGAVGEKLEKDHEVKYLDRKDAEYEQDITESFSIEDSFDAVIHTVGLAPGFNSAEEYRQVHVEGTENILEGVNADKIIYISGLKAGEIDHSFFRTKRQAEKLVAESGMDYTVVRPSTVYGEGNRLLDMIRKLSVTRVFPDLKTGTQPILLEDLAELVAETIEGFDHEVLRAAGPEKMTMGELAGKIYSEEGRKCFLLPYPQFILELKLVGLSFLPPPFQRENIQILRHESTTEENDARKVVELGSINS